MLLTSIAAYTQQIDGVWQGTIFNDSTNKYLPFEIAITRSNDFLRGYSYITYEVNGKTASVLKKIKINAKADNIAFEEFLLLEGDSIVSDIQNINLTYAAAFTGIESINGIWKSVKKNKLRISTGALKLKRESDFRETAIFKKLDSLDLTKDLSFNIKEPEIIPLAKMPGIQLDKILVDPKGIRSGIKQFAATKKTPKISIKAPVIIEAPKVEVAVVEKKQPPPPPVVKPIVTEKKSEPIVKNTAPPPAPKKLPPTVTVVKPPVEKKIILAPKKDIPVTKPPVTVVVETKKSALVVVKNDVPVVLPSANTGAADVSNRKISTIQTVEYQSDSLVLTLYDNGEVDGDTVSVLMNGAVIFSKVGLTTKPNRKTVYIDKDTPDSLTMVMYAENLGSIPPNTGLLVVWDGDLVYEVRFSADLKSNAAIIFRRKRIRE